MKSAVINSSDIVHKSGFSCMSAARWCEGLCRKALRGRCPIWEAGSCNASLPIRAHRIILKVDDVSYKEAVQFLEDAGYNVLR